MRIFHFLLVFLLLTSVGCHREWMITDAVDHTYRIDSKVTTVQDQEIQRMIEPYKKELDAKMDIQIGYLSHELTKTKPESTLGNFVTDLMVIEASEAAGVAVDFAAQNYGGLRINSLSQGPMTLRMAYELMPFDNAVVILKLKGRVVKQFLDHVSPSNGWPVSKEVNFTIENSKAIDITIKGEPLDLDREYLVALPDYVANGGDDCDFFIGLEQIDLALLVRDAIIDHCKKLTAQGKEISSELTGRIKIK